MAAWVETGLMVVAVLLASVKTKALRFARAHPRPPYRGRHRG